MSNVRNIKKIINTNKSFHEILEFQIQNIKKSLGFRKIRILLNFFFKILQKCLKSQM